MTTAELDQVIEDFRVIRRQLDLAERYFRTCKLGGSLASLQDASNGVNAIAEKIREHKAGADKLKGARP